MKKEFSKAWLSSKQPRKQRKYRYNATLHLRRKMLSAHLDKILRKEYRRRSITVRTGDEVVIMRGEYKRKSGKISGIDLKKLKIFFSSRRRHTRLQGDWSSDVCSSDLLGTIDVSNDPVAVS